MGLYVGDIFTYFWYIYQIYIKQGRARLGFAIGVDFDKSGFGP